MSHLLLSKFITIVSIFYIKKKINVFKKVFVETEII